MRIKFKNFLDTITSFIRTDATVARTYQFPDKDGTVAMTSDVPDVSNLPVSALQQTALDLKLDFKNTFYTKSGSYTLLAADRTDALAGKRLFYIMDSASAMNFTVPPDATVDMPIGVSLTIIRTGVGAVTFVGASPPTITGSAGDLLDAGQNISMMLVKTAANAWVLQNGSTAGKFVDYVTTIGGFSSAPTSVTARFTLVNKICFLYIKNGLDGISNATTYTMTIPFAPRISNALPTFFQTDNGNVQAVPGRALFTASSTTISLQRTLDGTAWTASGAKRADVYGWYEIA